MTRRDSDKTIHGAAHARTHARTHTRTHKDGLDCKRWTVSIDNGIHGLQMSRFIRSFDAHVSMDTCLRLICTRPTRRYTQSRQSACRTEVCKIMMAVVFDSKELTNRDRFADIVVMRCTAILKHKEKGQPTVHRNSYCSKHRTGFCLLGVVSDVLNTSSSRGKGE